MLTFNQWFKAATGFPPSDEGAQDDIYQSLYLAADDVTHDWTGVQRVDTPWDEQVPFNADFIMNLEEVYNNLLKFVRRSKGRLTLYRCLNLSDDMKELDRQKFGIFWSQNFGVQCVWGVGDQTPFVFEGLISPDSIDTLLTLAHNLRWREEFEVTVSRGSDIDVTRWYIRDEWVRRGTDNAEGLWQYPDNPQRVYHVKA